MLLHEKKNVIFCAQEGGVDFVYRYLKNYKSFTVTLLLIVCVKGDAKANYLFFWFDTSFLLIRRKISSIYMFLAE